MKKCKYCFELIQDEAIKCRYCNERLNRNNSIYDLLVSSGEKIIDTYKKHNESKNISIRLPTDEEGWILGDTHFFKNYLTVQNYKIDYSSIESIGYFSQHDKVGIISNYNVLFSLTIRVENEIGHLNLFQRENRLFKVNKETFEITQTLMNYITDLTFDKRLKCYQEQIETNGFFNYSNYKFYTNGRVIDKNDKMVLDLKNTKLEDVTFSSKWSGHKSQSHNPYEFKVTNGRPQVNFLFGLFETGHSFKTNTTIDNDIFNLLILNYLQKKTFL